jgi:hypothetical protein
LHSKKNQLSDNKTFQQTFSQNEIQYLQLLFDFFNENICPAYETAKLTDCYTEFFKRMEEWAETDEIRLEIPFEKQEKIYENISEETFQEIWGFGKRWNSREVPQDYYRMVHYSPTGKYFEFLKKVGKNDQVIRNYYEIVDVTGDITPSLIAGLLLNYNHYNIQDIRVKFIIAIHYLTLNDQFERKEKLIVNSD